MFIGRALFKGIYGWLYIGRVFVRRKVFIVSVFIGRRSSFARRMLVERRTRIERVIIEKWKNAIWEKGY